MPFSTFCRSAVLLLALFSLSACASIFRGTHEDVHFASAPTGAEVQLSSGGGCTTPCMIEVDRRTEFVAKFRLDGEEQSVPVGTVVSGGGSTLMVANILAGGIIGAGIDAATGAGIDHTPNPVLVRFASADDEDMALFRKHIEAVITPLPTSRTPGEQSVEEEQEAELKRQQDARIDAIIESLPPPAQVDAKAPQTYGIEEATVAQPEVN